MLSEISRYYIQNGEVIENSSSTIEGNEGSSLTDEFCTSQKTAFGEEVNQFMDFGGMAGMGEALDAGMVLAVSIWSDAYANMLWLDSNYPVDETGPGTERGPCSADGRSPTELAENHPDATVVFSDIRFGPIGSTYAQGE